MRSLGAIVGLVFLVLAVLANGEGRANNPPCFNEKQPCVWCH